MGLLDSLFSPQGAQAGVGALTAGLSAIDYLMNSGAANQANLQRYYGGLDQIANLRSRQLGNWQGAGNVPPSQLPSANNPETAPTLNNIASNAATKVPPMLDPLGLSRIFGQAADNAGNQFRATGKDPFDLASYFSAARKK